MDSSWKCQFEAQVNTSCSCFHLLYYQRRMDDYSAVAAINCREYTRQLLDQAVHTSLADAHQSQHTRPHYTCGWMDLLYLLPSHNHYQPQNQVKQLILQDSSPNAASQASGLLRNPQHICSPCLAARPTDACTVWCVDAGHGILPLEPPSVPRACQVFVMRGLDMHLCCCMHLLADPRVVPMAYSCTESAKNSSRNHEQPFFHKL